MATSVAQSASNQTSMNVMPPEVLDEYTLVGTEGDDNLYPPYSGNPRDQQYYVVFGLGGNDVLSPGNERATIYGGAGNDTIYGGGGSQLFGEDGNDTIHSGISYHNYYYIPMSDTIDGGAGIDTWVTNVSLSNYNVRIIGTSIYLDSASETRPAYPLSAENMEIVSFIEGTFTIQDLRDHVYRGTDGNDTLRAPTNAPWTLAGGLGNDRYFIEKAGDVVSEKAGEGYDQVITSLSHTLEANVESLQLVGSGNTAGTGNDLANYIGGNSGNNTLDGRGGADIMVGGRGNDSYIVDNVGDRVVEGVGEGTDRVISTISYTLTDNVENLQLVHSGNTQGIGNSLSNYMGGNSGNNLLDGRGGADTLYGGGGRDTFVFRAGEANGDVVGDFTGASQTGGDVLMFVGYGEGASLTRVGATDKYVVKSADSSIVETIKIAGVFDLATGSDFDDVLFA
ncbi:calcium-binding protein [Aureimonas sp. D3]|uniref:calcium-binding protein n=1 Tax=Aureimonas sp. D3 TaxID=1638164 RepID=UPI0012E3BF85|nr:calcium-binding protein [Aureimonas sp. D3]